MFVLPETKKLNKSITIPTKLQQLFNKARTNAIFMNISANVKITRGHKGARQRANETPNIKTTNKQ